MLWDQAGTEHYVLFMFRFFLLYYRGSYFSPPVCQDASGDAISQKNYASRCKRTGWWNQSKERDAQIFSRPKAPSRPSKHHLMKNQKSRSKKRADLEQDHFMGMFYRSRSKTYWWCPKLARMAVQPAPTPCRRYSGVRG